MPFLWNAIRKLLTKLKSPSPKHRKYSVLGFSIEKVSLPTFLKTWLSAGMTVEAAIVLPLFLFFFINLGSAMEMMRLHGNLQLALWDVGNKMCVYGYAAESSGQINEIVGKEAADQREWWQELGDVALTYTYVKSRVTDYLGEAYLEESPLRYGQNSLQFWESDVVEAKGGAIEEDILDIIMTYQISAPLEIPFVRPFRMSNRYYGRLWTGYNLAGALDEKNGQDVVYITENAEVYHESRDCTHLKLSVRAVSMDEAEAARNNNGGRYRECSKCGKRAFQGIVWISREGDFYHYDRECSGLKRTIYTILRRQAAQYRPCSRCAVGTSK